MKIHDKDEYVTFSNRRWTNRRRMAWLTLIVTLCYSVGMFVLSPERIAALAPIASYFYMFAGSVVGCYIGFATIGDKNDMDKLFGKDNENDDV